jgi:predicted short-subunit dehydrogenase-like oxidoreductase (DUF2520 family)
MKAKIHLLGAGRAGTALTALLHRCGHPIGCVVARSQASAEEAVQIIGSGQACIEAQQAIEVDCVTLVGVPDRSLAPLAAQIAQDLGPRPGAVALHLSGALAAEELAPLAEKGVALGSLHPLYAFAQRREPPGSLQGCFFGVEGEARAVAVASEFVTELEGRTLHLSRAAKPLHHAAAAVASNFLVTLLEMACLLEKAAGIEQQQALEILLPLVQSTAQNLARRGIPDALTGPIERGDLTVVKAHDNAIAERLPDLHVLHRELARHTLRLAAQKGSLTDKNLQALQDLLRS